MSLPPPRTLRWVYVYISRHIFVTFPVKFQKRADLNLAKNVFRKTHDITVSKEVAGSLIKLNYGMVKY